MNKNWSITVCCTLLWHVGSAGTINRTLFIVADTLQTVDSVLIPYVTFNEDSIFTQRNPVIELQSGDTLDLWIHNLDSMAHEFTVADYGSATSVSEGGSAFIQYVFPSEGVFIYHDPIEYPTNVVMGLAGMIVVKDHQHSSFYWNIKEHDVSWNAQIAEGNPVNWNAYNPKYFTVNSESNPNINLDPSARITGQVGDTLFLYMANTGQGVHSIHFHGYHAIIRYSSKSSGHVGREKDTFPIYPMETLALQLVPDKPGEYPVHDHNLVAVTGNDIYPNGMFSTMLITP